MSHKLIQLISTLIISFSLLLSQANWEVSAAAGPTDQDELETFLDGVFVAEMQANHVPGAVIAVVKDGSPFFMKGYGYADLENKIPVDPESTLFRPGSVSKLFVWTAVMQLVEQGKLSLDENVNTYLDFTIPDTYPQPITLKHIMTHTAGFEDVGADLFKLDASEVHPLGDYLKTHIPQRVYPPGEIGAYSNYATAVAGYIVERISGMSFNEYVEANILQPLDMLHATFRQPLPDALSGDMAQGYNFWQGAYQKGGFEFVQPYPVGGLSATASDMTHFMIAHLQNGRYAQIQILEEITARQMHSQLYTPDPRMPGMAYGFFESEMNGQRIISHGGDTILFHTGLYLLLEANSGIFISTNSTGGAGLSDAVLKAYMNRYYPQTEAPNRTPAADFKTRYANYAGSYTLARTNISTFEKIITPLTAPVSVSFSQDGYLILSIAGEPAQFIEVEDGLLQDRANPASRLAMTTNEQGEPVLKPSSPFAFIKTPWHGSLALHGFLLIGGLVFFLASTIGWISRFFGSLSRHEPRSFPPVLARWIAGVFGLLILIVLLTILSVFGDILPAYGVPSIFFSIPPQMAMLSFAPALLIVLGLLLAIGCVLAWMKGWWNPGDRVQYTLLLVSAALQLWVLAYWNII
jgi:CubicO group peptidase (beta-lactamase class C family)